MAKKETSNPTVPVLPMLKTVEQMSRISGIGENKLRELMDSGELYKTETAVCLPTLLFGTGTRGQSER